VTYARLQKKKKYETERNGWNDRREHSATDRVDGKKHYRMICGHHAGGGLGLVVKSEKSERESGKQAG